MPLPHGKRCHGCWSKGFYVGSSRGPRGLLCAAAREDPTLKLERTGRREAAEPVPIRWDRYSRLGVKGVGGSGIAYTRAMFLFLLLLLFTCTSLAVSCGSILTSPYSSVRGLGCVDNTQRTASANLHPERCTRQHTDPMCGYRTAVERCHCRLALRCLPYTIRSPFVVVDLI